MSAKNNDIMSIKTKNHILFGTSEFEIQGYTDARLIAEEEKHIIFRIFYDHKPQFFELKLSDFTVKSINGQEEKKPVHQYDKFQNFFCMQHYEVKTKEEIPYINWKGYEYIKEKIKDLFDIYNYNYIWEWGDKTLIFFNSKLYIIIDIKGNIIDGLFAPDYDLQQGDRFTRAYKINDKDIMIINDGDVDSWVIIKQKNREKVVPYTPRKLLRTSEEYQDLSKRLQYLSTQEKNLIYLQLRDEI